MADGWQILERDGDVDKAPQVVKEEINDKSAADTTTFENLLALGQLQNVAAGGQVSDPVDLGHKFGMPELPLSSTSHIKHRYDPVVLQVTNLLMKDGKKSVAQRVGSSVSLLSPSA
jgi:small subunit ribosomal protein S7